MKPAFVPVLSAAIALAFAGMACAQESTQAVPAAQPASAPASAAARRPPTRSPAVRAAENSSEPGDLAPEQRVIPQISLPIKRSSSASPNAPSASLPAGSVTGAVNDGAARCLASKGAKEREACERGMAASATVKPGD